MRTQPALPHIGSYEFILWELSQAHLSELSKMSFYPCITFRKN